MLIAKLTIVSCDHIRSHSRVYSIPILRKGVQCLGWETTLPGLCVFAQLNSKVLATGWAL